MKILVTGDGRVAKGVIEVLKKTNIKEVSKEKFLNDNFDNPIFCNLETKDYVVSSLKKEFDLLHFIKYPKEYKSNVEVVDESGVFGIFAQNSIVKIDLYLLPLSYAICDKFGIILLGIIKPVLLNSK